MAENHRSPGKDVIEVAVAVEIEEIGPFGPIDENRLAADAAKRPGGTVDAAGHEFFRSGEGKTAFFAGHRKLRFQNG